MSVDLKAASKKDSRPVTSNSHDSSQFHTVSSTVTGQSSDTCAKNSDLHELSSSKGSSVSKRRSTSEVEDDEDGDVLVLVGHDGVSLPPITFPPSSQPGGHLLSFLSCLENALSPHAILEPPLWLHRSKGKVFPRLFHSNDNGGSLNENGQSDCSIADKSNLSEERERELNVGTITAKCNETASGTSPKRRPFEKYILSVSLSNPIGELVSSSKLFAESIGKNENSSERKSEKLAKSSSEGDADAKLNEAMAAAAAAKEKKLVESRDFVFRIIHQHGNFSPVSVYSGSAANETASSMTTAASSSGGEAPLFVSSIISHFSFSHSAIMRQKNLLREAANMTVEKEPRPKLQHQPVDIDSNAVTAVNEVGSESKRGSEEGDCVDLLLIEGMSLNDPMMMLRNDKENIEKLCLSMRRQIMARAFYGWLTYVRHLKTVRVHLSGLVSAAPSASTFSQTSSAAQIHTNTTEMQKQPVRERKVSESEAAQKKWLHDLAMYKGGLSVQMWNEWDSEHKLGSNCGEILRYVYYGGMEHTLRSIVWLYLLGHYPLDDLKGTKEQRSSIDSATAEKYAQVVTEWQIAEVEFNDAKTKPTTVSSCSGSTAGSTSPEETTLVNDINNQQTELAEHAKTDSKYDSLENIPEEDEEPSQSSPEEDRDGTNSTTEEPDSPKEGLCNDRSEEEEKTDESQCNEYTADDSTSYSNGAAVNQNHDPEVLAALGLNLHRIDKDVARCDRNNVYFAEKHNLDKLRRIMCSYVWENLDVGYVQGMCDIVAPLLVIFDDESKTYAAFSLLMVRMRENFPQGRAMDQHFSNMRALLQILDPQLFEHMQQHGDYTHFYFCYRWFLLDFKRELKYHQVFWLWETIWAASRLGPPGGTEHFVLFVALALLKMYRKIIINYKMDFTDIIKFFNEMAECHNVEDVLLIARDLVMQLHAMLENK